MTDQEIQQAIAGIIGWSHFESGPYDGRLFGIAPGDDHPHSKHLVPDYPNDLNACHDMEDHLSGEWQAGEYIKRLSYLSMDTYLGTCHATARQRCEAFLRVLGKWKE